jgi:hypothetical protein
MKDVFRKIILQIYSAITYVYMYLIYVFQAQAWPVLLQGLDLIGIAQVCTFPVKTSVVVLSFDCIFSMVVLYFS